MWCSPGPRFATYFAIGESSAVASSSSMRGLAGRDEVGADALRRHLLGRFDDQPERVAVERERVVEAGHRDADVIDGDLH